MTNLEFQFTTLFQNFIIPTQYQQQMLDTRSSNTVTNSAIRRIKEHGVRNKIQQLCLDEIQIVEFTIELSSLVESCIRLEYLTLCDCNLTSLNLFPFLPQLQILELSQNMLQGEHLEILSKNNRLYSLTLDDNKIEDYAWTRFLKRAHITTLSLIGNPLTTAVTQKEYRETIYRALGADLQFLDGKDRQGGNVYESSSSEDQDEQESESVSKSQGMNSQNDQFQKQQQSQSEGEESEEDDRLHKKIKIQVENQVKE